MKKWCLVSAAVVMCWLCGQQPANADTVTNIAEYGLVIDGAVRLGPANPGQQQLAGRKIFVGNGLQTR